MGGGEEGRKIEKERNSEREVGREESRGGEPRGGRKLEK